MTILDRAAGALRPPPPDVRPATPTAAVLAALQAAATSYVAVLVPVVVTWLATATDRAEWTGVLRLGAVLWLVGQGVPLTIPGGEVSFVPLGLLAVCAAALVAAARRMARVLDPQAERIAAGLGRGRPSWPGPLALAVFVTGYAGIAAVASLLCATASVRPDAVHAFGGGALLAAGCGGIGALAHRAGGLRGVPALVAGRLPVAVRPTLRPAAVALAAQLAAGALLLVAALVVQHERVTGLHAALDPGLAGGIVLVIGQFGVVPDLVVWAASFLAGPGFAVGAGTSVAPSGVALGALPAVPVLGALPAPGPFPQAAVLVVAVPVAAGALAGRVLLRSGAANDGSLRAAGAAALVGVLAGTGFAVLCRLSAGGIGPGRLGTAGPTPWLAGGALALEVAAGALLVLGARGVSVALRRR